MPTPPQSKVEALRLLAAVYRRHPTWHGEWWAYHPALTAPPAKTEPWKGTAIVFAAFRDRLDDANPQVRLACVEGLKEAGAAEISARLRARFLVEAEPDVRRAILSALGSFRDEGSRALIVGVLGGMETDRALRAEAITAAELGGGDNVAKALEKCLRTEPLDADLKIAAVIVLGRLRYVSALPDLEAIAANEDEKARQAALDAVATIGGGAGRDTLERLANHASPNVRRGALSALGKLGPKLALSRLLTSFGDPETHATVLAA